MPKFRYSAFTPAGQIERGEIDCSTRAEVLSILSARGLVPFENAEAPRRPAAGQGISLFRRRRGPLPLQVYADLTRELSVLLAADIPLDASLRLLARQTANRRLGALAARLLAAVTTGQSLSAAISGIDPEAPAVLASLLRAGEARGGLAPALVDLAAFFESRIEMQGKIRSALTYPAVLCITALGAIAIIIGVLVPAVMPIFTDSGAPPPLVLSLAHQLGQIVTQQGYLIAGGTTMVALSVGVLMRRPAVRTALDRLALALPGISALVRQGSTALFARTLGTLLRNGVSMLPALEIAASIVPSPSVRAAVTEAAERVKEGRRLADALARTGRFSEFALRFVAVGEEASKLDTMLLHLADLSVKETQRSIDRAMTLVSPVLTIGIGALIGGLFVSIVRALLSVNELVLG
jgi:general secretion pathway protein F